MNKRYLMVFTALVVLALASNAFATRFETFEASADCDGYLIEGAGKVGSADQPGVDVPYTISLVQDGEVLDQHEGSVYVRFWATAWPFTVEGAFDELPAGEFHIMGTFSMPGVTEGDSVKTFDIAMTCIEEEEEEPQGCQRPRFWRHHGHHWNMDGIRVGHRHFHRDEARDQMGSCFRYPTVKRLFRHLVAAKLNHAAGNECHGIDEAIERADRFFMNHDLNERLSRHERREARRLKNALRDYNRGSNKSSWNEEDVDDFSDELTWDDLKASYR